MALSKLKVFVLAALITALALSSFFLGSEVVKKAYAAPSDVGQWSEVQEWPVKAVHALLLSSGKVMVWPSFANGDNPRIWDPISNSFQDAKKAGFNIFCSGHTLTADGKIFVAGGHVSTPVGLPTASIYNPDTDTWKRVPDMNKARWYPTTTTLNNGNILTISGIVKSGERNNIPQVFDFSTGKWRTLTDARLETSLYPYMYQAPNGKVFMAGNEKRARYLNTNGTGSWGVNYFPNNYGLRTNGTSVMYSPGKIMIIGGGKKGEAPTKTVEWINLNASSPTWKYMAPMNSIRRHANSTLLPNGKVLVTGGSRGNTDDASKPVYMAEEFTPGEGVWKKLTTNKVYRGYHSVALLLPDGRVLVAGGEKSGQSAEIYSPSYLFKGERPVISSAPSQVNHGSKFFVETPHVNSITKVRWIKLGSVTHSFNMGQRINDLSFVKKTNGLEITATGSSNDATPGHYMLFILNGNGVPSVAKIIKLGNFSTNLSAIEEPTTSFPPDVSISSTGHEGHDLVE